MKIKKTKQFIEYFNLEYDESMTLERFKELRKNKHIDIEKYIEEERYPNENK